MAGAWKSKAQLQPQGSGVTGGLGGRYGIPEIHPPTANSFPGTEAEMILYASGTGAGTYTGYSSAKTGSRLKFKEEPFLGNNAPRIFNGATINDASAENPRLRFSLTFKDETKCHVEDANGVHQAAPRTPSAIEERYHNLKDTDADWQTLNRFWLSSRRSDLRRHVPGTYRAEKAGPFSPV